MPDSFPGYRFQPAYWFYLLLGVTVIEFSRWREESFKLKNTDGEQTSEREDYSGV